MAVANLLSRQDRLPLLLVAAIALVIFLLLFGLSLRLLSKVDQVALIGVILKRHILSMTLFSLSFMLVFSSLLTTLSSFYVSDEMTLVFTSPAGYPRVFLAKFSETLFLSTWMVMAMLFPLLLAYGVSYSAPFYYYLLFWLPLVPYFVLTTALGTATAVVVARFLPINRTRNILRFLMAFGAGVLILLFRMLRPEQLVSKEKFTGFAQFLNGLYNPRIDNVPSAWTSRSLLQLMGLDLPRFGQDTLYLYGGSAVALGLTAWIAWKLHFEGWLRFLESDERGRRVSRGLAFLDRLPVPSSVPLRAVLAKDLRIFVRSPVLWSQLILMFLIVGIYVYNVHLFPLAELRTGVHRFFPDLLAFLNVGFVSFIITASALRFGYPSISMEGPGFFLIHASPLSMERYLWLKYWTSFAPLMTISFLLTALTNWMLTAQPLSWALSLLDSVLLTLAITGLALYFGARFKNLRAINFAQIPSSFGGMVFMLASMLLVAVFMGLQIYPVYILYLSSATIWRPGPTEWGGVLLSLLLSAALTVAVWRQGMSRGVRNLEDTQA